MPPAASAAAIACLVRDLTGSAYDALPTARSFRLEALASQPREEAGNGAEEEGRCFAKRVGQGERGPGRKGKRERALSARFLKGVEEKGLRNIFPFSLSGRERASFGTAALEEESPRLLLACLGWDGSCLVG